MFCITKKSGDPKWLKRPYWERTAYLDDNGMVFVPICCAPNEYLALKQATLDGAMLLTEDEQIYLDAAWLSKTYPVTQDLCASIREIVLKQFDLHPKTTKNADALVLERTSNVIRIVKD